MWQPDPAWIPLPSGSGPATVGVWRAQERDAPAIVKRLGRPGPDDPVYLSRPDHAGYWRREAEVALSLSGISGPGLVSPHYLRCEEDDEGITLWSGLVLAEPPTSLVVARALGRFAGSGAADEPWAARGTLNDRIAIVEARGGWPTLQRTTLADVADHLWSARGTWLDRYASSPQGRVHGDAVPGNFVATRGEDVVGVDWQGYGSGPIGSDLGYFALSAREDFEVLLETYLGGLAAVGSGADPGGVRIAATVVLVYTVFSRAEWALSRVAQGEGALAGKYGHPAVAPHLRALQRQAAQIEALVG